MLSEVERLYSNIEISVLPIAKPFLKWVGGKTSSLNQLRNYYPVDLGQRYNRYVEPFLGGGAVFFDLISRYSFNEVVLSDANESLIHTYTVLRDNPSDLLIRLKRLKEAYCGLDPEERRALYLNKRREYNQLRENRSYRSNFETGLLYAALFIFLNKTCFNGLFRVNSRGEFNSPWGAHDKPGIFDPVNLSACSQRLQNVQLLYGDFSGIAPYVDDKTFIYFDPPYRPVSQTSSFTSYQKGVFNDERQIELFQFFKAMVLKGAYCLLSNSDPRDLTADDFFFENLYASYEIKRLQAPRNVNRNGDGRGKVNELLIIGRKVTIAH